MMQETQKTKKAVGIYLVILSLVALANGLSNDVFSNYFKEVYQVSAYQRGIIEFPRELPGILSVMLISALSFLGDIRTSIIAQLLSVVGIIFLGLVTPAFGVMLIFLFLNSFGMHLFMPLSDSIGMSLIGKNGAGRKMGLFKGFSTAFTMLASVIIFIGFRKGLFSFDTQLKPFFLISAGLALVAAVFLVILYKLAGHDMPKPDRKFRFLFRRKYKYYYILAIMYGVQKQIMAVYAPWVLIDLLFKKADTLALLTMAGAFAGIFFIPALGRWIDRFGLKKMLYADALSFIGVYVFYGILSSGFYTGTLAKIGLPVVLTFILFIIDRMSMQMGIIRTLYLREIAVSHQEITPTLSLGMSMDHIVSIACAYLGGIVWTIWGPQYVFFLAAALSIVNLVVARLIKIPEDAPSLPISTK